MSQMLKSSGAMSGATLISRVLGMVRDIFYTQFMGTGWVADAFNLAFMVPNLFRRLLGEGALTAAFIPIFKEKEKLSGEQEMWRAANAVISGLVAASAILVSLGVAGISLVLLFQARGVQALERMSLMTALFPFALTGSAAGLLALRFTGSPAASVRRGAFMLVAAAALLSLALGLGVLGVSVGLQADVGGGKTLLMLRLLRLMFPYVLLVCLAALFIGVLNSRGYFFVPAMGATMLNVVMITSVLTVQWLAPKYGWKLEQQIFGLAIGVVIAGIAQAAFQVPLLRKEGFRFQWVSPWRDETVRRVVTKMIPGAVGVAAFQINVLITQSIAFWAGIGVVSSFTVAVRLMELPQGGFGISLATYLLPTLSGLAAEKKYAEFRASLRHGLSWLLFVNLLASALLFTLAEPMIRLLFERGAFNEDSTTASALALTCLAPGLVAFSVVNILARAFYALGDTTTPMRISIFCLALNLIFAAALVLRFKQAGLGIANTLSAVMNMTLLLYALRKKLKTLDLAVLLKPLIVLTAAAIIAGAVAWKLESIWNARIGHYRLWLRAGEVFVPIAAASLVYLAISIVFKTGHVRELAGMFRTRVQR
jgi:putative peptidoglycan lipid II flippase